MSCYFFVCFSCRRNSDVCISNLQTASSGFKPVSYTKADWAIQHFALFYLVPHRLYMCRISSKRKTLLLKNGKRRIRTRLCTRRPQRGITTGTATSHEAAARTEPAACPASDCTGRPGRSSRPSWAQAEEGLPPLLYLREAH